MYKLLNFFLRRSKRNFGLKYSFYQKVKRQKLENGFKIMIRIVAVCCRRIGFSGSDSRFGFFSSILLGNSFYGFWPFSLAVHIGGLTSVAAHFLLSYFQSGIVSQQSHTLNSVLPRLVRRRTIVVWSTVVFGDVGWSKALQWDVARCRLK